MRRSRPFIVAALAAVALLVSPLVEADGHGDYSDPDYLAFDLDTMARTTERQGYHFTTPDYWLATHDTALDTWSQGVFRQWRDADDGRIYASVGQIIPGGNLGDPEAYRDGPRHEVEFLNREGTKLVGNVWPCLGNISAGDACPSAVVTTGSIQVTQHMYGWLARHLQANGYTVFTFDVRGQGESETTTHENPFPTPANPQDGASFQAGTVDALRFLLSTPTDPYVPVGWTHEQVDTAAQTTHLDRYNPEAGAVLPTHLALIGHSLGASAVSVVQQCTDVNPVVPDGELPAACAGQRFPIRAIVAYDSLSAGEGIQPAVPAFDHRADGYFINAVPSPQAPDPEERTGGAYAAWTGAGQDACTITGRGFTHAEWSQIPYIVSATRYGVPAAAYYTQAWLDRHVHPLAATNAAGHTALAEGPIPQEPAGQHLPHRATLFSGKYRSACQVSAVGDAPAFDQPDLRAYAGVAAVGDWAAINAEEEHGGDAVAQGAAHPVVEEAF